MAENGNSIDTPVDVVATTASEETSAASAAKGKGKAVASEVQDDVTMDEDEDEDEDDDDEDEVSSWQLFAPRAAPLHWVTLQLTDTF